MRVSVFVLLLLFAGCVTTSNVPDEVASNIPDGAEAIKVYSGERPQDHFKQIYRSLAGGGFGIEQENAEMGTLSTNFKEVGQETMLQVRVFVEEHEGGSLATLRGKWSVTSSMSMGLSAATGGVATGSAEDAVWGKMGRPSAAFGEMAMIAEGLDAASVEYVQEQ